MTDSELVQEIRKNNHLAFAIAYEKYHKQMYAFAYKYTRYGSAAEDIVQQAFLKLWENRSNLNPVSGLGGYLFTISKNLTLNTLRSYNSRTSHTPPLSRIIFFWIWSVVIWWPISTRPSPGCRRKKSWSVG